MNDFLGFFAMRDNYKSRKVGRFEANGPLRLISTACVSDSDFSYETGIAHDFYNDGKIVVVENYDSKKAAEKGHAKWVKKMTSKKLPNSLLDVSCSTIRKFLPKKLEFKKVVRCKEAK